MFQGVSAPGGFGPMTTEDKTDEAVSAADEQDDDASVSAEEEQIAQAVADAQDAPGDAEGEQDKAEEAPAPITAADLDSALSRLQNQLQGRQANYTAEQLRQFRREIDASLSPLREQMSAIEQARVQQMEPEEQAEYWRNKALQQSDVPAAPDQPAPQSPYSETEVAQLRGRVEGMLSGIGLENIDPQDDRLWSGARVGASIDDLFQVARRNAQGLLPKTTPAPREPEAPKRPRVPSTTGAPRRQGRQYTSRTDIAEALTSGEINSDQAREYTKALSK